MSTEPERPARCAVILGPYTSGKTTLLEAILYQTGAIHRKGSIPEGSTLGDSSPEARRRQMTIEPNFAHFEYLGEPWSIIDCPGSVEMARDRETSLMAADLAILVAPPEPERARTMAPMFKFLDDHEIPHVVFINKMDKAAARVRDILEALQAVSSRPLVLRQIPIRDDEEVTGFIDLASERAWKYNENKQSDLIEIPASVQPREEEARQEMLESLADFDDTLLEQLLEDVVPPSEEVYQYLSEQLSHDSIVPVLFGSAEHGHGITRLLKVLRHECPDHESTAKRLDIPTGGPFTASVLKTIHAAHTGKLSVVRLWHGALKDGTTIGHDRASGVFKLMGAENTKLSVAKAGDLVALGRMDDVATGDLLTEAGRNADSGMHWPAPAEAVYALAIQPKNRQDEVKLTASIGRLIEEDASLALEHNADTHQMLLWGQGEIHLKVAIEHLKNRYNVDVGAQQPMTSYKETIKTSTIQHSRFKRQTGGHGQFGDVHVEIGPLPRGSGFEFIDNVVGGSVPRQYISAVETGTKDYLSKGPLGFPVVDVKVRLFDGQHHAVDSSDMAFRTAGRLAMSEGMPNCRPVLLEPVYEVVISVPSEFTNKVHSLVSGRRGQILGFEIRRGWKAWDELKCQIPQAELRDLIIELRSLTFGVGSFTQRFDHLQELSGRLADNVITAHQEATEADRR